MHHVVIVNFSANPGLTAAVLSGITLALAKQAAEHVAPLWSIVPPALEYAPNGKVVAGASALAIFDTPEQAGYLGYHSVGPDGVPYGRVFVDPILRSGGTLFQTSNAVSVTLSHEWLELIGDPAANEWCDDAGEWSYAEELCDPCQGDAYLIDGVMVSDFVTPLWFEPYAHPAARFDHMSLLTAPFQLRSDGYAIRRPQNGGPVQNVWGAEVPEWKKALKGQPASRTSRRNA